MNGTQLKDWYNAMYDFPREVGYGIKERYFRRTFLNSFEELMQFHTEKVLSHNLYLIAFPQRNTYEGIKSRNKPFDYSVSSIQDRIVFDLDDPDDLDTTWEEAQLLYDYAQEEYGGDPLLIFTGRKGFQVYIYFKPVIAHWKATKLFQDNIADKLITTADKAVHGDPARLLRMPYSQHQDTQRYAIPVERNMKLDTILAESIGELDHNAQVRSIQQRRGEAPQLTQDYNLERIKRMQLKAKKQKVFGGNGNSDINNWNVMDKIFPLLYEEGLKLGDRYTVSCPFHSDKNPSAFYSDKVFYCSTCHISVGTYNFLTQYAGKTKEEALKLIRSVQ